MRYSVIARFYYFPLSLSLCRRLKA